MKHSMPRSRINSLLLILRPAFVFLTWLCCLTLSAKDLTTMEPVFDLRMGAVLRNEEIRFKAFIPQLFEDASAEVFGYDSSCPCLRLATPLPLVSDKEHNVLEFAFVSDREGFVDIQLSLSIAAKDGEHIAYVHISGFVYGQELLISAKTAVNNNGSEDALLVDIRDKTAYEACHAEGALQMDRASFRGLTALRNRSIIVIGNSLDDSEAILFAGQLKHEWGFSQVKALKGGNAAWQEAGGRLSGPEADSRGKQVTADDVLSCGLNRHWVPVLSGSHVTVPSVFPEESVIRFDRETGEKETVNPRTGQWTRFPEDTRFLFISDHGDGYPEMERHLPKNMAERCIYLQGGMEALNRRIAFRQSLAAQPQSGTIQSGGRGSIRTAPCGGCGRK